MSKKYDALDNIKLAEDLRTKLILESADIDASLDYELATDHCRECPLIERSEWYDRWIAAECCKDNPDWNRDAYKTMEIIEKVISALTEYIGDAEPQIASLSEEEQP